MKWNNLIVDRSQCTCLIAILFIFSSLALSQGGPVGFASLHGNTTGGYGGDTTFVYTRSDLLEALDTKVPLTILIIDTIDLNFGERIPVEGNNISLVGKNRNSMLRYGGLMLYGNNIIVQNLSIGNSYTPGHWDGKGEPRADAITVYGNNIWIDHCDLFYSHDGLLDFSNRKGKCVDFVTVSWTRFSNHNKVMLIGSGDQDTLCRGTFHITLHHCWFDGTSSFFDPMDKEYHRIQQRMPRVRFGIVHVFNCYYEEVEDYAVAARIESQVVVENCVFRNLEDAIIMDDFGKGIRDPELKAVNNIYENVKHEPVTSGQSFHPADFYSYAPDDPQLIPEIVMNGAGKFNRGDNHSPVAAADTIAMDNDKMVTVYPLQNDVDSDGDSLRISAVKTHPDYQIVVLPDKLLVSKTNKESIIQSPATIDYEIIDFQGGKSYETIYLF